MNDINSTHTESGNYRIQPPPGVAKIRSDMARRRPHSYLFGDEKTNVPRPIGGVYLKHAANVILHFKEFSKPLAFQ